MRYIECPDQYGRIDLYPAYDEFGDKFIGVKTDGTPWYTGHNQYRLTQKQNESYLGFLLLPFLLGVGLLL